ncbi:MAG: UDP-N-acetylmuramate--L-alanine ligase [Phycisphaerae bacterium]|nr:UDP-N-acetylmuramate--L-alanine ligase [Phycisphaerae bacterium]
MAQGARTRRIPQTDAGTPTRDFHPPIHLGAGQFLGKRVHLVGIGGCGMRGTARILLRRGAKVSGSDASPSDATARLIQAGVAVSIGQRAENVPEGVDVVVYSAAIKPENPELVEARRRGCETIKYAELLGRLMQGRDGIAVAGTHGKSTTTAMTAFILKRALTEPSFVIGAMVEQLGGGSGVGDGPQFVVEACEFDRSFLHLAPRFGTILNVEEDHLDYYRDLAEIIEAFGQFARLVPEHGALIVNGECKNTLEAAEHAMLAPIETFGFGPDMTWRAVDPRAECGCYHFKVAHEGRVVAETHLQLPGEHHVGNALAAIALCSHSGVPMEVIARLLPEFRGAQRRLTLRGRVNDVTVLDDYAHHPTEIRATLAGASARYKPRRLWVVFQPHQHSRTRFLLADFAASFDLADHVLVPDIYFVRDSEAERDLVTARDLVEHIHLQHGDAEYEPDFARIVERLANSVEPGDVVLTMGAGNVWRVADELVARLSGSEPIGEFTFGATAGSVRCAS